MLPVGIALERFRPIPRAEARARLGLDPAGPYLLFPHDPARPLKRFDRAREAAGDVPLLHARRASRRTEVPYWINAANAVVVPSQDEGFGLSVIEALACGVPAFGTPVGIHPVALHGDRGRVLRGVGPRALAGGAARRCSRRPIRASTAARRAELFSADRMADRVVEAWRAVVAERGAPREDALERPAYTRRFERIGDRAPRPTMSGLLRRIKRSRPADAGEPPVEGQAAAPEGAAPTGEPPRRRARATRAATGDARLERRRAGAGRPGAEAGGPCGAEAPRRRSCCADPARRPGSSSASRRRARRPAGAGGCAAGCATCAAPAS